MLLETETNTVESFKEVARNLAALADAVGEQVRPAFKVAVDAADKIVSAVGNEQAPGATPVVLSTNPTLDSLDEATREFGVLIDAVGDQVRPAVKLAVGAAEALTEVMESAKVTTDRLWKSLGDLLVQGPVATA